MAIKDQNKLNEARAWLAKALVGAQLDCFRCYSMLLQLCFFGGPGKSTVWVSSMSELSGPWRLPEDASFEAGRQCAVGQLYGLIGQTVTSAEMDDNGGLTIALGDAVLRLHPEEESFEEAWYVTGDTPDLYGEPDWVVALDSSGEVSTKLPK